MENHCSGNPYDNVIKVFAFWPHGWVISSLENENEALCFIFYKNETTVVPKKSLEKLEICIVKIKVSGKFVVEMMFSGEIQDKAFYQTIRGKKLPHT